LQEYARHFIFCDAVDLASMKQQKNKITTSYCLQFAQLRKEFANTSYCLQFARLKNKKPANKQIKAKDRVLKELYYI
jgi:hypothetical protein